ncbi:hypothetical protein ACFPVX_23390 [Cohnella faecalis]|uniref:Uncharacterized protein n=1 Tax=Cohnella faecalis TaxID=2315694 RepID=A0A398CDT2_9BACL|nr:hypothetical protein [Cohnella faecalis]RIE01346.1 hypothetical protein D3H35_23525 [Cohnella faecalis]
MLSFRGMRDRNVFRNERGSILLYCMGILLVLVIVTPVILNGLSTQRLSTARMESDIQVNTLASGAAEAFLQHVGTNGNISKITTYQGWGEKTITLPNGNKVVLKQSAKNASGPVSASSININTLTNTGDPLIVTIEATSGKSSSKVYRYNLSATSSVPTVNSSQPKKITDSLSPGIKYVLTANEQNTTPPAPVAFKWDDEKLYTAINNKRDALVTEIKANITKYEAIGNNLKCGDCLGNPTIKKEPGTLTVSGSISRGGPSDPVILIVGSINVAASGGTLTVYGDVIADSIATINNGPGKLYIKGNLYSKNGINLNNPGDELIVDGRIYAKDTFQIEGPSDTTKVTKVTAESIVATNLYIRGNSKVTLTINDSIIVNAFEGISTDQMNITVTKSDLLAATSIKLNNSYNISAGGVIAGGYWIDRNRTTGSITASGAATALQCSDGSSIFTKCSSGNLAFQYKRK